MANQCFRLGRFESSKPIDPGLSTDRWCCAKLGIAGLGIEAMPRLISPTADVTVLIHDTIKKKMHTP